MTQDEQAFVRKAVEMMLLEIERNQLFSQLREIENRMSGVDHQAMILRVRMFDKGTLSETERERIFELFKAAKVKVKTYVEDADTRY